MNPLVVLASFLASSVEATEAFTIVLAVWAVHGRQAALRGTFWALLALGAIGAAFGPALLTLPLAVLRAGVGTLILLVGLKWLRKAILRAAGRRPARDEDTAYARTVVELAGTAGGPVAAAAPAFSGVLLEGLEVIVVVVTLGASGGAVASAAAGALLGAAFVTGLGLALRRPLSAIPENTLKFTVGVLLMGLGTLWAGEGVGVRWPGGDVAVAGLVAAYLAAALLRVRRLRTVAQAGRGDAPRAGH